jgi:CysZ protein
MRIFQEFFIGLGAYTQAVTFIGQHRLWRFLIIPALINLAVFLLIGAGIWTTSALLSEWLIDWTNLDQLTGFWGKLLRTTFFILVKIIAFLLYYKLYRYTVLLVSAPALAMVAEKTQEIVTGITHPFSVAQLLKDMWRGIGISLRNLCMELLLTVPLYLLAFIPFLTPFVAVLILGIESYFVGFSMIDYRNEYRRIPANESIRLINFHKGLAIGNGLVFNLLLTIPLVGVLVGPSLAVVAGGLASEKVITR